MLKLGSVIQSREAPECCFGENSDPWFQEILQMTHKFGFLNYCSIFKFQQPIKIYYRPNKTLSAG